jgi:hypothetical protein
VAEYRRQKSEDGMKGPQRHRDTERIAEIKTTTLCASVSLGLHWFEELKKKVPAGR